MKKCGKLGVIVLLLIIAVPVYAQDSTSAKALNDPLLDKLIGDWSVERTFRSGRASKNFVHAEWVLRHQFLELHCRDAAAPPTLRGDCAYRLR
jgi:hypothetical protein